MKYLNGFWGFELLLSLVLALVATTPSTATATNVRFCADYKVAFDDVVAGTGDDFFNTNDDKIARGVRVRVTEVGGSDSYYGYTPYNGSDAGCTPFLNLDPTQAYRVRMYSEALVGTNYIRIRNNPNQNNRFYYDSETDYVPPANGTATVGITSSINPVWNVAAATGYAQYRRRGGISNSTYLVFDEPCPGVSGSCATDGYLFVDGADRNLRYVIVHEMGHVLADKKNGGLDPNLDASAASTFCSEGGSGHRANSREFQSVAADEGFAHFYAAVIFNDDSESSCGFFYSGLVDWDFDGTTDTSQIGCEGGPIAGIDGRDYMGDFCIESGLSNDNRGVEWDWLRHFWDLTTDQGVYFTDVARIWNVANPDSWNANGNSTGPNYPSSRLRDAAGWLGFLNEWDNSDDLNGAHR